jgi:hypothetical protein
MENLTEKNQFTLRQAAKKNTPAGDKLVRDGRGKWRRSKAAIEAAAIEAASANPRSKPPTLRAEKD